MPTVLDTGDQLIFEPFATPDDIAPPTSTADPDTSPAHI